MAVLILISAWFLWFVVVEIVKDTHTKVTDRRRNRIMATYQRQEAVRMHAWSLADIDRTTQATVDEMIRVAAEADSDVIEGTAVEVRR